MRLSFNLIIGMCLLFVIGAQGQTANFSIGPTSSVTGCVPHAVSFQNLSSGATSYLWDFGFSGPGGTSTLSGPVGTVYYAPGTYTVKLTAYNGSSSNTMTKTMYITVRDTPKVDFSTATTSGCVPFTANFTNLTQPNGSSATYFWVFQGATPATSTATSPAPSFTVAGNHNVTLQATNNYGCKATKTKTAYIRGNPKPSVNFSATSPTIFCDGSGTVDFAANVSGGGPYTYLWSFGSTVANPTGISFSSPPSSHTVKLTVTGGNGCKDSAVKVGFINFTKTVADFTVQPSACVGEVINFTNTTTPCMTTAKWYFSATDSAITLNTTHSFSTPGTKTVMLVTWCGPCPDTISKTVVINALPVVDFKTIPDSPCPAPMNVQFVANNTYSSYQWAFGTLAATGPAGSTSASPVRNYTANGFDTVTLTVRDANGCENYKRKAPAVKIFDLQAKILPDSASNFGKGCAPLTIHFDSKVYTYMRPTDGFVFPPNNYDYPYGVKTYHWYFGDGTEAFVKNPIKTYTDTGVFKVRLYILTNNNCYTADSGYVYVGNKPNASFVGPDHICFNHEDFVYTNTTLKPPPFNKSLWFWIGDSTNYDRFTVTSDLHGVYRFQDPKNPMRTCVRLVNLHNECPSDTFMKCITVDSPKAIFSVKTSCHKDSLKYVKFTNGSLGATTWKWYFGDGNTSSTAFDTLYKYTNSGNYQPMLVTFNAAAGCSDTFYRDVSILAASLTLVADDTAICVGQSVHFTATLNDGGNISTPLYTWNIGGYLSFWPSNTFDSTFSDTGRYKITVETSDEHNCTHYIEKDKWIFVSKPSVNFTSNPPYGCTPATATFIDQTKLPLGATIVNRAWTFPGGTPATASNNNTSTTTTLSTVGSIPVKLVITDNLGCKDSVYKPFNSYKPTAALLVKDTGCLNQPLTFFNKSSNFVNSYWDFGDLGTSTANQPDHPYSSLGVYPIRLIVEDAYGCRDTVKKMPGVAITRPVVAFTVTDSVGVCIPLLSNFINKTTGPNSQAYTYLWNFGNGSSSAFSPSNAYVTPGVYKVTLIATTPHGCVDSASTNVRLYGFAGSLSYGPVQGCVPLDVTFTPVGVYNIPTITWDFTDGNVVTTSVLDPIKHTYIKSGAFLPKLILQDMNGCKTVSEGIDTIKVDETWANFNWGPACEYDEMSFFDSSYGLYSKVTSWIWAFDTSTVFSYIKDPKHYYGPPGKYSVRLVANSAGQCTDTIEKIVTVRELPIISAGTDTTICLTDSATLMPFGGVSYVWTPQQYLSCDSCTNPLAGPPKKFTYKVIGTDAYGCRNTDTVVVSIKTKVTAFVGPGGEICDKDTFSLVAWGANTYVWRPSESLNDYQLQNPTASPHENTDYIVVAYEGRCIPDTHSVKVIVHPLPDVKAEGEVTIVAGKTADLRASGSLIRRFEWTPAEDLDCADCAFPIARPSQTTSYKVTVYTEFGCVDSDRVTITVLCDQSQLFIPNTFTPNGDGQNDFFYPRGDGLDKIESFRIYNRWGETVFQRTSFQLNDQYNGWDGSYKGSQLSPDVFVWVIDAVCDDGKILTVKGDVTLIR